MNSYPDVATKIRYSGAGEQVEVELDPARMSREEIAGFLDTLRKP